MGLNGLEIFGLTTMSSATMLGIAWLLFKDMITTRLKESVKHEYDGKLAILQAQFDIKGIELNTLRTSLLSGATERQKVLYIEKVKAIDKLWNNVNALTPAKLSSASLVTINYQEILKEAERDPKVQEFFNTISPKSPNEYFKITDAHSCRPYLSDYAWLLFKAYSAILSQYNIMMEMLKLGTGADITKTFSTLAPAVKAALPEYEQYIDDHEMKGLYYLLEPLEEKMLVELQAILDGRDDDEKHKEAIQSLNESLKAYEKEMAEEKGKEELKGHMGF